MVVMAALYSAQSPPPLLAPRLKVRACLSIRRKEWVALQFIGMTEILAVSHFCKGERILKTFQELGCRTVLLSRADRKDRPWPRHLVDEIFFVEDFRNRRDVLNAVSYLQQDRDFKIVAPLDEFAVGTCATIRAHLACPGLCEGTTRKVRDKLTMRCVAKDHGIPIPPYCGFNNKQKISELLAKTNGPWMLKHRSAGGSVHIRKLHHPNEAWEHYRKLGDARSNYILEEFVPGEVYHVDTIIHEGKFLLEVPGQYLTTPFDTWNSGGVFAAKTVARKSALAKKLLKLNRQVIQAMGVRNGVNHAEFLGVADNLQFLEVAARVPGSNLDQLSRAATGVDLFRESAKIQFSRVTDRPYEIPKFRYKEAGIVQCLAREEQPDIGDLAGIPERTWSLSEDHHAGMAFASTKSDRIDKLTTEMMQTFADKFLAVLPATEPPI